jgi:hypothetical protein
VHIQRVHVIRDRRHIGQDPDSNIGTRMAIAEAASVCGLFHFPMSLIGPQAADPACPLDVRCLGVKRTRYAPPEFFRA